MKCYLIFLDNGAPIFGLHQDEDLAAERARNFGGVVVEVDVVADYRKDKTAGLGS